MKTRLIDILRMVYDWRYIDIDYTKLTRTELHAIVFDMLNKVSEYIGMELKKARCGIDDINLVVDDDGLGFIGTCYRGRKMLDKVIKYFHEVYGIDIKFRYSKDKTYLSNRFDMSKLKKVFVCLDLDRMRYDFNRDAHNLLGCYQNSKLYRNSKGEYIYELKIIQPKMRLEEAINILSSRYGDYCYLKLLDDDYFKIRFKFSGMDELNKMSVLCRLSN